MKKYYFIFGILGLLVGYFSKSDFWFEDGRDIYFPITKAQLKKKSLPPAAATTPVSAVIQNNGVQAASSPSIVELDKLSQAELFHELYNSKILQSKTTQAVYFEKIKNRFQTQYPAAVKEEHRTGYEKEVANRLGILRAMSHFWPTPREVSVNKVELKKFFQEIAKNKNENFMIRRQAIKSWLTFGNSVSQGEKEQLFGTADSRLLHLVSLSDEALIQSLAESAE